MSTVKVRTVRAEQEYRAIVTDGERSESYLLMLSEEYVHVFTKKYSVGLYSIDRFGGALSPNGIRRFFS